LDSLSNEEQEKAEKASLLTARYLWNFLSGMTSKHKLETIAA
jgi:pyrroloquinoline-quinone synthase